MGVFSDFLEGRKLPIALFYLFTLPRFDVVFEALPLSCDASLILLKFGKKLMSLVEPTPCLLISSYSVNIICPPVLSSKPLSYS